MLKPTVSKVILLAVIGLLVFVSWITSSYMTARNYENGFGNVLLYTIGLDARINEIISSKDMTGSKEINEVILNDLINLAIYRPAIDKLEGTPLKILCQIIQYDKRGGFSADPEWPYKKYAIDYLDSVSGKVLEQVRIARGARPVSNSDSCYGP